MNMICPDCGHDRFTADHSAMVRRTYNVIQHGSHETLIELSESIEDVDRDLDVLTCEDCGAQHAPEDLIHGSCDLCDCALDARRVAEGYQTCEDCESEDDR
jgi:hypothetical protein